MIAVVFLAILAGSGIICVVYQKEVRLKFHAAFENGMTKSGNLGETPPQAQRPKAPEVSLARAVIIKTPDGELTIPKGSRVRVIEKSTVGTVAVNYQGYTAPVPSDALAQIPK